MSISSYSHSDCAECGKHDYVAPLHGERGGPRLCLLCSGKWHGKYSKIRKARRVLIKAMKAYSSAGGRLFGDDFERTKLEASGVFGNRGPIEDFADLTTELLKATLALTHPDRHPDRREEANQVTRQLLALAPFVFPEETPEPKKPKPRKQAADACARPIQREPDKPSAQPYPCEDCRDTVPLYYCQTCKARWEKDGAREHEVEERKRQEKNAKQRKHYQERKRARAYRAKPRHCETCGEELKSKRADARYCSAACRQAAYLKRDGNASNHKPVSSREIEITIENVFACNPHDAFSTDDLCDRVFLGDRIDRKHRVAVVIAAKKVSQRLGEHRDWWRSEASQGRGQFLVFWNRASVTSYAMARLKAFRWYGGSTMCRAEQEAKFKAEIAPGGCYHEHVVTGGCWWEYCQEDLEKFKHLTDGSNHSRTDLRIRHTVA